MKKKLMSIVIASLAIASCSNETFVNAPSSDKVALEIEVSVAGPKTKGIITGTSFPVGSKLGVFLSNSEGIEATKHSPIAIYNNSETASNFKATGDPIYLDRSTQWIFGFYPYFSHVNYSEAFDRLAVPCTIDAYSDLKASDQTDYMYASGDEPWIHTEVNEYDGHSKVKLQFNHALSKLTFLINLDNTYKGEGKLTEVALLGTPKNDGYWAPGNLHAGDGVMYLAKISLDDVPAVEKIVMRPPNPYYVTLEKKEKGAEGYGMVKTDTETYPVQALVAPIDLPVVGETEQATSLNSITLQLIIDGKTMLVYLPNAKKLADNSITGLEAWGAGMNHQYTITVFPRFLEVDSNVTIAEWKQSPISIDNLEVR